MHFPYQVLKLPNPATHFTLILVDELLEISLAVSSLFTSVDDFKPDEERILSLSAPSFPVAVFAHTLPELTRMPRIELSTIKFQDVYEKYITFIVRSFPFGIVFRLVLP